ncbi:MAG: aldehyde dehydrogenase family protein [Pseudomonadota bacterium]
MIDGAWCQSSGGGTLDVMDPSTGEVFATIARGQASDVDDAVAAARATFKAGWGDSDPVERGRILSRLGTLIERNAERLWRLEARDTGKPLAQAKADIAACARYFEFYGGAIDKHLGQTLPYKPGFTVLTVHEPYGVTGHIIPWNYPAQVFGRTIGGGLATGNCCVLKPAEDACQVPLALAELALEAGLRPGVLNVVTGLGDEAGAALASHPGIDHISFTGSPATGSLVQAASANFNRPVTMELGGKSPQIVFDDADLDEALPFLTAAIVQNAGQTCSAGSRLLVQDGVAGALLEKLADRFGRLVTGPSAMDPDCGPLINAQQKQRVDGFLAQAKRDGLPVLARGQLADDLPEGGHYVPPTLIDLVPPDHPLAQEEVFGPVLSVLRFADEQEAIELANATPFGLVAGVWTQDGGRQMRVARMVRAGQVFVNNYGAGGGVELPFGGVGRSGFGREKGLAALDHFSTLKTIAIKHG